MVNGLLNHLKAETTIPFVYMAWSHSEERLYGVVTLSDQEELSTDHDSVSEKMAEGYVDVFTKDPNGTEITQVEACLRNLGIWFKMESTQYENDTGYIHYEWRWRDTNGIASEDIALIRFVVNGQTTESWVAYGTMPTAPTLTPYWNGSVPNRVRMDGEWDKPIVEVDGNAIYTAVWYALCVIDRHAHIDALNVGMANPSTGDPITMTAFTAEAFAMFTEAFESGGGKCVYLSDPSKRYPIISIDGTHGLIIDEYGNKDDIYFSVV